MSQHLKRKVAVVTDLVSEFGISPIHAHAVAMGWEYAANRQGIDRSRSDFWEVGRPWMIRQLATPRGDVPQPH